MRAKSSAGTPRARPTFLTPFLPQPEAGLPATADADLARLKELVDAYDYDAAGAIADRLLAHVAIGDS